MVALLVVVYPVIWFSFSAGVRRTKQSNGESETTEEVGHTFFIPLVPCAAGYGSQLVVTSMRILTCVSVYTFFIVWSNVSRGIASLLPAVFHRVSLRPRLLFPRNTFFSPLFHTRTFHALATLYDVSITKLQRIYPFVQYIRYGVSFSNSVGLQNLISDY